jgi:hypothetical protein
LNSGLSANTFPFDPELCAERGTSEAQFPYFREEWHDVIGDPTYADAILDRLVHNAHRINLTGDSLRRKRSAKTASDD